jgi:hypothetical protein
METLKTLTAEDARGHAENFKLRHDLKNCRGNERIIALNQLAGRLGVLNAVFSAHHLLSLLLCGECFQALLTAEVGETTQRIRIETLLIACNISLAPSSLINR